MTPLRLAVGVGIFLLAACGRKADVPTEESLEGQSRPQGEPSTMQESAGEQPSQPEVARPTSGRCIEARWQATDFVEGIRQSVDRGLRGGQLTRAQGNLIAELQPGRAGTGDLVAVAQNMEHRVQVRQHGINVTATHRMSGGSVMPYRLVGDSRLLIEPPREGELTARVTVSTNLGVNLNRGTSVPVNFVGTYEYTCSEEELTVRRVKTDGELDKPISFERIEASEPLTIETAVASEEQQGITDEAVEGADRDRNRPRTGSRVRNALEALKGLREAAEALQQVE